MSAEVDKVKEVFRMVRENFVYEKDLKQYGLRDDWRSHAANIKGDWKDDCDGVSYTAAEVAAQLGRQFHHQILR